jgi:hypothetical protein
MPPITRYKASPQSWEDDSKSAHCFICQKSFSTLNRRHHCRECGRVVCKGCSENFVAMMDAKGVIEQNQRCCNQCFRAGFAPPQAAVAPAKPPSRSNSQRELNNTSISSHGSATTTAQAAAEAAAAAAEARAATVIDERNVRGGVEHAELDARVSIMQLMTKDATRIFGIEAVKRQITAVALRTLRDNTWVKYGNVEGVELTTAAVPGFPKKAVKAVFDIPGGDLASAVACVSDFNVMQRFEPSLFSVEARTADDGQLVTLSKYKSTGMISGRDFASKTAEHALLPSECRDIIDCAPGETITAAYVRAAVDDPTIQPSAGYVRGTVHSYAFVIAEVATQSGEALRVVHLSHADPKGSIPTFAFESTFTDIGKKLAKVRDHVSERSRSVDDLRKLRSSIERDGDRTPQPTPQATSPQATTPPLGSPAARPAVHIDPHGEHHAAAPDVMSPLVPDAAHRDDAAQGTPQADKAADEQGKAAQEDSSVEEVPEEAEPEPAAPAPRVPAITAKKRTVLAPLLALHKSRDWRLSKTLDNCDLEDAVVSFSDKKALRITTTMQCSLATLKAFLEDASQMRKYDPTLDVFEMLPAATDAPETRVTYSAYKQQTRLIAPRDFCAESTSTFIDGEDAKAEGLPSNHVYFLQNSIDSKARPPVKSHTRGVLHMFGYVAEASYGFESVPITVRNIMCIDPSGKIPTWLIDAAQADSCKKLAKIRQLVEERHRVDPGTYQPAIPAPPSPPASKKASSKSPAKAIPAPPPLTQAAATPGKGDTATNPPVSPGRSEATMEASDGDFHSCVDEDEFKEEQQELRNFHQEDVDRICSELTTLHVKMHWSEAKMVEGWKVQSAQLKDTEVKVTRISAEFPCGLEAFKSVITNMRTIYQIDPAVETVEMLPSPPFGSVIYTAYKSGSRLLTDRDFCSLSTSKLLSEEEGAQLGLYTRGIHSSAFVVNSVNSTDMPLRKGYVRGTVRAYGYIAVATPPSAKRIRVFHIACIDPSGNIPGKVVDLAVADTCKKVSKLRDLCVKAEASSTAQDVGPGGHTGAADSSALANPIEKVEGPFLQLQTSRAWTNPRQIGNCRVEDMAVPDHSDITAHRLSTEFLCSAATFDAVINTPATASQIDSALDVIRIHESKEVRDASVIYTAYRSQSRLFSSRDFCTVTTSRLLAKGEGGRLGLHTEGIDTAAFLSCSTNSTEVQEQHGYVRGKVHAFGYLALATPATAKRIRVFHIAAISPGGNVSSKWVSAAISDTCAKLVRLKVLCEEREKDAVLTAREVPEPEVHMGTHVESNPQLGRENSTGGTTMEPATTAQSPESCLGKSTPRTDGTDDDLPSPLHEVATEAPTSPTMEAVPEISADVKSVLRPLLDLHSRCATWKRVKVLHECVVEETAVSFSDKSAQRITTTMQCSLKTFNAFLSDIRMLKKYDPTLQNFEVLPSPEAGTVTYSAYKQATRLIAARDFCTLSTRVCMTAKEAQTNGIETNDRYAIVTNGIDSTLMPPQPGFVRGKVHVFGYFATGDSFNTVPITVHNIMCVDPSGNIPKWVVDVATTENVKKLAKIRELVRSYHVALLNRANPTE